MSQQEGRSLQGVIFDLDGTLFDIKVDWPGLKDRIGERLNRKIGSMNEVYADKQLMAGWAGEMIDEAELAGIVTGEILPGVAETLNVVSDRFKLAVVTRNGRRASSQALERLGLRAVTLVTRDEVERHKPHPEAIELALTKLGLQASDVVVVGDSTHDVEAAQALGITAVAVPSPNYPMPPDADHYLESMADLTELLTAMNS